MGPLLKLNLRAANISGIDDYKNGTWHNVKYGKVIRALIISAA